MAKTLIALIFLPLAIAVAQDSTVSGRITYIAGDVVYTSIGRNAGVKDSTVLSVVSKTDTIAQLKVFGTSSKSSVCYIVSRKHGIAVNDSVVGTILHEISTRLEPPQNSLTKPSPQPVNPPSEILTSSVTARPFASVQGRISLQYFRNDYTAADRTITQPGIAISLRGKVNDLPLKFEVYGNLRSLVYGNQLLLASNAVNRSRIYRVTLEYDDNTNRIAVGRLNPPNAPSLGYTDGLMVTRRFGSVYVGTTLGYEPDYLQRTITTTMKKFSLFGGYTSDQALHPSVGIAYARTFFHSSINREVLSSNLSLFPMNELSITAMADVDIRTPKSNNLTLKPELTSLFANVNYRPVTCLDIGIGLNAARPIYSFESIASLPDTMIDQTLRSSPNLSINLLLPYGTSFSTTYVPRSSSNGFGHEYSDYSSIGFANIFHRGLTVRLNGTVNVSSFTSMRGIGATAQKSILELGEVYVRCQFSRYEMSQTADIHTSSSVALDLLLNVFSHTSVWGSIERMVGLGADGYSISADVSWRF